MFLYYLYSLFTAPGVVVHELAHALFCVFSGVKIYRIKLFSFGKTAGFVMHDEPTKFYQSFLISIGPLLINSFLAMLCFARFKIQYTTWQPWVFVWLGFAVGMHAIPLSQDAKALFQAANHRFWHNPLVIISYPLILILYILYLLKKIHIDIIYVALLFWLGNIYLMG